MNEWKIINADCLDAMREMADNSIDFVVCDPPYGLHFMGKKWDGAIPAMEIWAEALRVCKPGAMLAAFGGSRTHHHLMLAVESAGWEIRDVIMWVYGSGFPKSHNIEKAINREYGCTEPDINYKNNFKGYGTALKPAYEPIIIAMKPIDGTFAQNAEKWGVAGINVDGSRIPIDANDVNSRPNGSIPIGINEGKSFKNISGRNPECSGNTLNLIKGRWPANIIFDEEAAQELDQMSGILKSGSGNRRPNGGGEMFNGFKEMNADFPASSGGASRFFYCAKASSSERNKGLEGMPLKENDLAKAYKTLPDLRMHNVQNRNPKQNTHPTVKPISLMKYIIKLLAPPGNPILLDPFAGSGSTIVAAKELGISAIGIEKEAEYAEIAQKRLDNTQTITIKPINKEPENDLFTMSNDRNTRSAA